MKLHLPLLLRSALLAILASATLTHATQIVISDEDGRLEDKTYYDDLEIIVQEGGILTIGSDATKLTGNHTTLDVYGSVRMAGGNIGYISSEDRGRTIATDINVAGGTYTMNNGYIGYIAGGSGNTVVTTVNVTDGTFTLNNGRIAQMGGGTNNTFDTTVNVAGGAFTLSRGHIGLVSASGIDMNANINTTINLESGSFEQDLAGIGMVNYFGSAVLSIVTTIDMTGGTYTMNSGSYIGFVVLLGKDHIVDTTINVGDGYFEQSGGYIGYISSANMIDVTTAINVTGGTYVMKEGGVTGNVGQGTNNKVDTTINLEAGSFEQTSSIIGAIGSPFGSSTQNTVTTTINLKSGSYEQNGGNIGQLSSSTQNTMITTINVTGGTYTVNNGSTGYVSSGCTRNTVDTTINVEAGSYELNEGRTGYVYDGTQNTVTSTINVTGGTYTSSYGTIGYVVRGTGNTAETAINVEAGSFYFQGSSMKSGIGYIGDTKSDASGGTTNESTATTTINVTGGTFNYVNGEIGLVTRGTKNSLNTTINIEGGSFVAEGFVEIGFLFRGHEVSAVTEVNLKGGTYTAGDETGFEYGNIGFLGSCTNSTADTTINIEDGTFLQSGGSQIGRSEQGSDNYVNTVVNLTGGAFTMSGTWYLSDSEAITQDGGIGFVKGGTRNEYDITINVDGGSFEQNDAVIGFVQLLTWYGGYADAIQNTVTTEINVRGGRYTMRKGGVIGYVTGGTDNAVETTINVEKGSFIMKGGDIGLVTTGEESGNTAKVSINVTGGSFEMEGGRIAEGAGVSADVRVGGKGKFIYEGGSFGKGVEMVISDAGVVDMSGKALAVRTVMTGGELRDAAEYAGELELVSVGSYRGELKLGGVDAARVQRVRTGEGVRVSGWHGALTIHEGDYMYVGAEHVGDFGEAGKALLSFAESGSVVFAGSITLYFEEAALAGLESGEDGKPEFEIYFTDGTLNERDVEKITLGNDAGWKIVAVEDGRLMINGALPKVWYASEHVSAEDGTLLAGKRLPLAKQEKVVVDRDARLSITTATQMNYLQGDSALTLDGAGNVALHYAQGETVYAGSLRSGAGVVPEKTGAGSMRMTGELHAEGTLRMSEGKLTLAGAASSIRRLDMSAGELQVEGALELGGGRLSGGSITGGGALTLTGELALDGQARMAVAELHAEAVRLHVAGEAQLTLAGGSVGAEISVSGEGVLRYEGGTPGKGCTLVVAEQGTLDLTGQKFTRNLTIRGGRLKNAEQFIGTAQVEVDEAYSGVLDFGGADAARFRIRKAGRGVNFSGLKEWSLLTLDADTTLRVGAEHITLGQEHEAQQAVVSFLGSGGEVKVAAGAVITLEFDAEALFAQSHSGGDARMEVWFCNGALDAEAASFSLSGGWDMWVEEASVEGIEDGRLLIRASLDDVWFAADHVGDDGEVRQEMPQGFYGKVVVNKDTHLTLRGDVQFNYLEGTRKLTVDGTGDVTLCNKAVDTVYAGDIRITSGSLVKSGAGAFTMTGDLTAGRVLVQEGDFILGYGSHSAIGELAGRAVVQGVLELQHSSPEAEIINKMQVTLRGSAQGELQLRNLDTQSGAALYLQAGSAAAAAQAGAGVYVAENAIFRTVSTTTLLLNMSSESLWEQGAAACLTAGGQIFIERGAKFVLSALQEDMELTENLVNVTVMSGLAVHVVDRFTEEQLFLAPLALGEETLEVQLEGLFYVYYGEAALTLQDNALVLNATLRSAEGGDEEGGAGSGDPSTPETPADPGEGDKPLTDVFEQAVSGGGAAYAGAAMLDRADLTADGTLAALGDALGTMLSRGEDATGVMAAVAGSAVTTLGSAQREAMRERMLRARAHAEQGYYVPQDKKLHTWIEAAASYAKVSADADESGYKLDSWGGSVGVDYAVSSEFTLGLTLTAMYGDLTAEATEQAEGKLDAYYVSLWAHKQSARWGHSFLVMVSTSDATLDRTVNYGTGAYTAQGSTSGSGYGAMYELTYDIPLSETSFWQPLMSISMVSTSMDAYNETGAEGAGLAVGEQEQTVTTVSLGARWVSRTGADLFGRAAVVELSARVAQDMGDTRSEAENALLANPGYTRKVQGAEVGSTAAQIGAGLAIPTGKAAQFYLNANADLRSNATNWNMGAGIRFSF